MTKSKDEPIHGYCSICVHSQGRRTTGINQCTCWNSTSYHFHHVLDFYHSCEDFEEEIP